MRNQDKHWLRALFPESSVPELIAGSTMERPWVFGQDRECFKVSTPFLLIVPYLLEYG
jgi:hypothetical protein